MESSGLPGKESLEVTTSHSRKLLWYNNCYYQNGYRYCNRNSGGLAGAIIGGIIFISFVLCFFYLISVCWRRRQLAEQSQYGYDGQQPGAATYPAQPYNGSYGGYPNPGYPSSGPPPGYPNTGVQQGYPVSGSAAGYHPQYPPTFVAHVKSDFQSFGKKFGSGRQSQNGAGASNSAAANTAPAGGQGGTAAPQDVQMTEVPLGTPTGQQRPGNGPAV
ncbi:hypothetical protein WJX72_007312 [[Myrmecia] bisecta]|uniref:Store-operated calcium entry-associated regulatory factor n=1 Tax=[Myrmecia] bisecta TaxID=41462 RepID=A0AAW1Q083_9CHLO